jgi:hypothetical protein
VATGSAANAAPTVNAGADAATSVGEWLILNASYSDDALPQPPGVPTLSWLSETDPASVTFAPSTSARTSVNFSKSGTYTLAFTANDGALATTDRLVVNVAADDAWDTWRKSVFTASDLADPEISGGTADPDRDGMINRDEFTCGTDPKSAASALRLVVATDPVPALQFQSVAGRAYALYFRASLTEGTWGLVESYPTEATSRTVQYNNAQPGYYRIAVP